MMARKRLSGFLALCSVVALSACASTQDGLKASADVRPPSERMEYRIGPGDELSIAVWKEENLSRTVPVRPDGMISLPLLNDVKAAGLTPMELRDVLRKRLAAYISKPEVSVIVKGVGSFKISVMGEVKKPGVYDIGPRSSVLDALARAEGLTDFASRSAIVVLRPEGGEMKRLPFNYNKAVSENGDREIFQLRPGDIVVVP